MNVDRSLMKAAVYRRYGPPDAVQIADVPRPDLRTKDVLVKVRATTVTAGDSRLRSANVPRGFGIMTTAGCCQSITSVDRRNGSTLYRSA